MDLRIDQLQIDDGQIAFELVMAGAAPATEDGLRTAVIISLFTDARADDDDTLPDGSSDRRGWWADTWPSVEGDATGSHLWLLAREKQLPAVLTRAQRYARAALQWLIDDGIASDVTVVASFPRVGVLLLEVAIERLVGGPVRYRFEQFWSDANAV